MAVQRERVSWPDEDSLIMRRGSEPPTQTCVALAHVVLPRAGAVLDAFRGDVRADQSGERVLATARELAAHHLRQWHAEDASRAPDASLAEIAASKRLIDELNGRRVALVERMISGSRSRPRDVRARRCTPRRSGR